MASTSSSALDNQDPHSPRLEGQLTTSFRGRLGYACINMALRERTPSVFMSRTCTLGTIRSQGIQVAKERALLNVRDISTMLDWNEERNIRFMRLSSDLFPFASHEQYGYSVSFAAEELKAVGDKAKELGHRLTFHPGQYTQLASPREEVVRKAALDLRMHAEIMDVMGLDQDSVMVIHMGGVFHDKANHASPAEAKVETLARFEGNFLALPKNVRDRLVLENDDVSWSVEDLIGTCEKLSIPLVLDHHHSAIVPSPNPLSHYLARVTSLFRRRGITPKQHLSEPANPRGSPHQRREHAFRVERLPEDVEEWEGDLMVEAKGKEIAVLALAERYGLVEGKRSDGKRDGEEMDGSSVQVKKSVGARKKLQGNTSKPGQGAPVGIADARVAVPSPSPKLDAELEPADARVLEYGAQTDGEARTPDMRARKRTWSSGAMRPVAGREAGADEMENGGVESSPSVRVSKRRVGRAA